MGWQWGSIPITYYGTNGGGGVVPPPVGFLLLTDLTNLLMTDGQPILLAGG